MLSRWTWSLRDFLARRRRLLLFLALALGGVALGVMAFRGLFGPGEPPEPTTATVRRTDINTVVTATGTLVPAGQQNVGFLQAGELIEVNVKVGDRVKAGQVLARIDPTELQAALEQSQADLRRAEADLANVVDGNAVEAARDALDAARKSLKATQRQADAIDAANSNAIDSAERQLAFDRRQLERDQAQLRADQQACDRTRALSPASPLVGRQYRSAGSQPIDSPLTPLTPMQPQPTPQQPQPAPTQPAPTQPQQPQEPQPQPQSAACDRLAADRQAVDASMSRVIASQTALTAARDRRRTDRAAQKVQIASARAQVVSAQSDLDNQTISRPNNIEIRRAAVSSATAAVEVAQQSLNDATLTAPLDGTVVSLDGRVGETVNTVAGRTALAPATQAPEPDVDSTGTTAPGTATAPLPEGTVVVDDEPFITLGEIDTLQIVAPFPEADASQVQPGQAVDLTFDAIEDLTRTGSVLAVAPTSTVIEDVINYYVTIDLDELHPQLRAGQTANIDVILQRLQDVLAVPTAAIERRGGKAFVNVLQPDGTQTRAEIQTGATGDGSTEVISGIDEGERVVLPEDQTTAAET